MYVVIAPVVDQSARTKPTIVMAIPVDGLWSRRCRLSPSRLVACPGMTWAKWAMSDEIVSGPTRSVNTPTVTRRTDGIAKNVEYASADASIVPLCSGNPLNARTKSARQSGKDSSRRPGSASRGSSRSGCGACSSSCASSGTGRSVSLPPCARTASCCADARMRFERIPPRSGCGIGAGRFELPASRPQTGRSDQAELRPDEAQCKQRLRLLGLDERAQLGELLAAELVAVAPRRGGAAGAAH